MGRQLYVMRQALMPVGAFDTLLCAIHNKVEFSIGVRVRVVDGLRHGLRHTLFGVEVGSGLDCVTLA